MSDSFNTTVTNWQGVDSKVKYGSKNLVESNGAYHKDFNIIQGVDKGYTEITIVNQYKNIFLPLNTGETFKITLTQASAIQYVRVDYIDSTGTVIDVVKVKLDINIPYEFTPENNYAGIQVGYAGTAKITLELKKSINDKIGNEKNARETADTTLQTALTNEVNNRKASDIDMLLRDSEEIQTGKSAVMLHNNSNYQKVYMNIVSGRTYKIEVLELTGTGNIMVWYINPDGTQSSVILQRETVGEITLTPSSDYIGINAYYNGQSSVRLSAISDVDSRISSLNTLVNTKIDDKTLKSSENQVIQGYRKIEIETTYSTNYKTTYVPLVKGESYTIEATQLNGSATYIHVDYVNKDGEIVGVLIDHLLLNSPYSFIPDSNYAGFKAGYAGSAKVILRSDKSINDKIKEVKNYAESIDTTLIRELYAYADGDASNDDATHFYGWKQSDNGQYYISAIQRAIDSCVDGLNTYIYCIGHTKVTAPEYFTPDGFKNVVLIPSDKKNIHLIGKGIDRTSIEVRLSDSQTDREHYQPMAVLGDNCSVEEMSIIGKNCRYCVHIDSQATENHTIIFKSVRFEHIANAGNLGYNTCLGLGTWSGLKLITEECTFVNDAQNNAILYIHDNVNFKSGYNWKIKNCIVSVPSGRSTSVGRTLFTLQLMGSNTDGLIDIEGIDVGMVAPIITCENNNAVSKTDADTYDANIHPVIKGRLDSPIGYNTTNSRSAVLRITSKSLGKDSKVRFDKTSSAFDVICNGGNTSTYEDKFGVVHDEGYQYRDGGSYYNGNTEVPCLAGYAMGELALDKDSIVSLQSRLGDCSSNNKNLIVTVDGTDYTITFNQDYTSYTDTQMLAVFTDVIGSVANVELYNWGADYFPELEGITCYYNNSSSYAPYNHTLLKGMGVHLTSSRMYRATNDEELDGILLDDVLPGKYGRVVKKAYLAVFEGERHHVCLSTYPSGSIAEKTNDGIDEGAYYGIGNTPGVFEFKQSKAPLVHIYNGYLTFDL